MINDSPERHWFINMWFLDWKSRLHFWHLERSLRVKRKYVYICWMCNGPPEFVCCLLSLEWLNCLLNCRPKLHSFILKKKCYSQNLWRHFPVVFHTGWKSRTSTRFLEITTLISITQVHFRSWQNASFWRRDE